MKKKYTIHFIDGHDLKYKTFETVAESKPQAVSNLWDSYKEFGDFDHRIGSIVAKPLSIVDIIRG